MTAAAARTRPKVGELRVRTTRDSKETKKRKEGEKGGKVKSCCATSHFSIMYIATHVLISMGVTFDRLLISGMRLCSRVF